MTGIPAICPGVPPRPVLRGYSIEWAEPSLYVLSRRNVLYTASSPEAPATLAGAIRTPLWQTVGARSRLVQRLLRYMFYNVLKIGDATFLVSFDREIGILEDGVIRTLPGRGRASRVLRGACAQAADGAIYFGEYLDNSRREPVSIFRYSPGNPRIEEAYRFSAGAVRHVHGVYRDPFTNDLWCVTGDRNAECQILRSPDHFVTLEVIGGGDETWRCVSLLFTRNAVYYATDAEFRQNHIYRLDRSTNRRDQLAAIEGPCYYTHSAGEELYFAVTAELCPSQVGDEAVLWRLHEDTGSARVARFRKDRLSVRYFMPGTLHFPNGPGDGSNIYFGVVGVEGDGTTFSLPLNSSGR